MARTSFSSVASDGMEGNGYSAGQFVGLSADGRFVSFVSDSSNLVPGDTNNEPDIFVHDRETHQTTRVSVASNGTQGNGSFPLLNTISADGRFVAFDSCDDNLVPEDNNGKCDVFVHNRITHKTSLVSIASGGTQGNHESFSPFSFSADGRLIAFYSDATNLVPGDTNGVGDIFVRDSLLLPSQSADLSVTQTESADPVAKGGPLTYTVTVTNNGPDPAANVSLTDLVPLNALLQSVTPSQGKCYKGPVSVCRLGSLAANATATVTVNLKATKLGTLKNTVYINAPPKDVKPGNNSSHIFTQVQ